MTKEETIEEEQEEEQEEECSICYVHGYDPYCPNCGTRC